MSSIDDLQRIAEVEFADIVTDTITIDHKLRIFLIKDGFIDVNLSQRLPDNFPDKSWIYVSTYPYHFHNGSQDNVEASPFPLTTIEGFRAFMEFVRSKMKKRGRAAPKKSKE